MRTMRLWAASLLLSFFTPLLVGNGAAHVKNRLPVMKFMHNQSDMMIKMLKRQLNCPDGEYHTNVHCCKLCPAGTTKSSDCSKEHDLPQCTACQAGMYMDIPNNDEECHRCTLCDHGEGFEIDKNCSPEQNTICQCMEHYFCNATLSCKHCEPCDKCENRYVKEECTRQKNTVCQDLLPAYAIVLIVLIVIVVPLIAVIARKFWCRKKNIPALEQPINELHTDRLAAQELLPPVAMATCGRQGQNPPAITATMQEAIRIYKDADMEPHFTDIAGRLELDDMLLFVRKNGMIEPTIEQIKQDNVQNTNEQKIKLLSCWYKGHGRSGAFSTLINTLHGNGCHNPAEKISQNLCSSAGYKMASNSGDAYEESNV